MLGHQRMVGDIDQQIGLRKFLEPEVLSHGDNDLKSSQEDEARL
jgi:hypothetical protein